MAEQFESVLAETMPDGGYGLYPVPPETHHQTPQQTDFDGAEPLRVIHDSSGRTAAWLLRLEEGAVLRVRHGYMPEGKGLPEAAIVPGASPFDRASDALAAQLAALDLAMEPAERCRAVIQFVTNHFRDGRLETPLGAEEDAMPALCGLMPGSCVDMHTMAVAALRAAEMDAAYVIGGHIADYRTEHPTGHC